MPEVGVLNLTIRDNSDEAGKGLDRLAAALSAVKAAKARFDLSTVGQQVTELAKTIQQTKGTSTIIKNLGTMFNAINKFSQLKDFTIDAEKLRDTAMYMNRLADGMAKMNEARQAAVHGGGAHDMYGQMAEEVKTVKDAIEQTADSVEKNSHRIFNIQLFGGHGDNISLGQSGTGLEAIGETESLFQKTKETVDRATEEERKALEQTKEAIDNTTDAQIKLNEAGEVYAGVIRMFDASSGSYKNIYIDTSKITDAVSTSKESTDSLAESMQKAIDLTKIPASGKNGVFANAAEEARYLKSQIDNSIVSQEQWLGIYNAAEKQMKYGGPRRKEDLDFNLRHSEEGYYAAIEAESQYKSTLSDLLDYVKEYTESARQGTEVTLQQAESMRAAADAAEKMNSAVSQSASSDLIAEQASANQYAIQNLIDTLNTPINVRFADVVDNLNGIGRTAWSAEESMSAFLSAMQGGDEYTSYIRDLNPEFAELSDSIANAGGNFRDLHENMEETQENTGIMVTMFGELDGAMGRMFPTISGLLKRFKSMMTMRSLRYVIRQIASGLSEGVKNVYYYSQAVGTSFAPAMDSAATSLKQMKNSIGAALAPAIQALIPVLQTVVSWFITLVNYVNQFFALLRGQSTWTRALPQATTAFKDQTKAAKGASNAMKDLLADWDELNIIQSQSGSGGGGVGGVAEDYATMFEEVSTYDTWINDLVSGIDEKFGSVLDLVKRIGVIIGAWKISQAFSGVLGTIAGLVGAAVTLDVVFNLVSMFSEKYLKTGEPGWLVGNALTTLFGAAITKKILGKVLNGKIASYAIPVTLFVSALADAVAIVNSTDVTALSKENLVTSVLSATKTGLGAGYLLYKVGGFTNFADLAGIGGGVSLMTFGVLVGIRAIKDTVDTRQITAETIKADLLSAGAFGGGIGLIAATMGVGLAGTLVLSGVGALLVLGALVGIEAIIASEPKAVQWGDFNATQEAIKAWVEDEKNGVFTASPKAILSVIDPLIEVKSTEEEKLKATVENVKVIAKKISLGIDEDSALKDLEHQIFGNSETGDTGLIGKFKSTAKAHEEIIETGLTIVPVTTNEDGTIKEIISRQSDAWKMLTGHMDDLGRELWGHMQTAYSESVDEGTKRMELKTISDLTTMMVNVSAAITQGEQYENAMLGLEANLENLSEGSWNSLFDYIEQYKKEIVAAYTKAYDEVTVSMAGLTSGLQQSMENERYLASTATTESEREKHLANAKAYEDEYNYWFAELTSRREGRQAAIEQAAKDAENEETYARIRKILADKINKDLIDPSDVRGFDLAEDAWTALFDLNGARTTFAKDQVTNWLDDLIDISFGDDADTIKKAVHLGMLGYNDVFQESVIAELASEIGITGQDAKVQSAWNNLIKELFGDGYGVDFKHAFELDTRGVEIGAREMMKYYKGIVIENIDKSKIDPSDVRGLGISEDAWTALFDQSGKETSFAKDQVESWLDSLIDASFGSDASIVKEAVRSGMRGYGDVFSEAVVHALAEKIGIPGQSQEVIDAWNRLVEETFGSGYGVVVEPEVIVKPKVESSSLDNAIEQVKGALKDGVLARYEKDALINALGSELFEQALASIEEELGNVSGEHKSKSFGGGSTSPLGRLKERALEQARIVAHGTPATANVAGVDYNAIPYVGKAQPEITEVDIANGVANGTARGNAEQNVLLRDAVNYLMRIAAKDFSVNINPSTLFARTANASENMYTKVTGG